MPAMIGRHHGEPGLETDGGHQERPLLRAPGGRCGRRSTAPARKTAEGGGAGRDGEAGGTGEREADQDDVAGHVGGEHVAEPEVADGIDDAAHHRERGEGHARGAGTDLPVRSCALHLPCTRGDSGRSSR